MKYNNVHTLKKQRNYVNWIVTQKNVDSFSHLKFYSSENAKRFYNLTASPLFFSIVSFHGLRDFVNEKYTLSQNIGLWVRISNGNCYHLNSNTGLL